MIDIIGSDWRTERYSVADETAIKNTNVAKILSFSLFVRGVYKKQELLKIKGMRTISGNSMRMKSNDFVVNSTV